MFTAQGVTAILNDGKLHRGWVIYHLRIGEGSYQPTELGFVHLREGAWPTLARCLPGIRDLGNLDITGEEWVRLNDRNHGQSVESMRRMADAIEGN